MRTTFGTRTRRHRSQTLEDNRTTVRASTNKFKGDRKIILRANWNTQIYSASEMPSFYVSFLIPIMGGGVQTGSTWHVGHFWPILPAAGDCEDGKFGVIKIGKGNRSTRRKPAPAPLRPPQPPIDQTRARARTAAVGIQRLTAWTTTRTKCLVTERYSELYCGM
jgi:hypothetical protein